MPIPFGFSVGDFIVVSELILKIIIELRKEGQAAPEYQNLVLELEALDRALKQLQHLRPGRHDLRALDAIRAASSGCQRPLQQFLFKISRFESSLGTGHASLSGKPSGFLRRMQWALKYKDDVKELRSILGSQVCTINLLLMTQAFQSIVVAEVERSEHTESLEGKIQAQRLLLDNVQGTLESQRDQLSSQGRILCGLSTALETTKEQATSLLAYSTRILYIVSSNAMSLQRMICELVRLVTLCSRFTCEMRQAMTQILSLFRKIYEMLVRIDSRLLQHIDMPIIKFHDVYGNVLALPYQLCQTWPTFTEMIGTTLGDNALGRRRVEKGHFLMTFTQGGAILRSRHIQHMIRPGAELSMLMVIEDLEAQEGYCHFPGCGAPIKEGKHEAGGVTCPECYRVSPSSRSLVMETFSALTGCSLQALFDTERRSCLDKAGEKPHNERENDDVLLYRRVHAASVFPRQLK